MEESSYQIIDGKVVLRVRDHICDTPDKLLKSPLFFEILKRCINELERHNSPLLNIFEKKPITHNDLRKLVETLIYLGKVSPDLVPRIVEGSDQFFRNRSLFFDFTEYLYNYWRSLQRLVICDSEGRSFDKRPYRTFNNTVEQLTHLVRSTYRDLQENISGNHPRIYRQVRSGAEIAAIALPGEILYPDDPYKNYKKLNTIPLIRQVLIYPPLIFSPPMNKRTGMFERVAINPLDQVHLDKNNWLCYPARVGPLLVMVYFNLRFFELGFSLCNLFELADDEDLKRKPDAVYLYGVPDTIQASPQGNQTIFYEDQENDLLVATIPERDEFGYFGYLKKMVLTLHNIKMMKIGRMPFHGAMVHIKMRNQGSATIMFMGDTGAGKSETLEALRAIAGDSVEEITIIADDMGSLDILPDGRIVGYGTETGAFVRLDDLKPGYAFGQIDRTIIMSPAQVNARVVLPVTTYENVMRGYPVDFVLYANNYDAVDEAHPIIESFQTAKEALDVFRAGAVMSKGTTTTTGLVNTYFANIFGPEQYQKEHEGIAKRFFNAFFERGVYVGQLRTRLGLPGWEQKGPEEAARQLMAMVGSQSQKA
jgi:hypothetical protein